MQTSLKIFVLGIWNLSPFKICFFSYIGDSIKESGVLTLETIIEPRHVILTSVDSDQPVQHLFMLRNFK